MKKNIIISFLALALIISNGWWLYHDIDTGVTTMYHEQILHERTEMLHDLLTLTPKLSHEKTRHDIVDIAEHELGEQAFEKEGVVWVGWLGLVFHESGNLIQIIPPWNSGEGIPAP